MSAISFPYTFSPNTTILSAQVNANFAAVSTVVNGGIDHTNVGSAGFYATQIIPTNAGLALFGGSFKYTFPNGVQVNGSAGITLFGNAYYDTSLGSAGVSSMGPNAGVTVSTVAAYAYGGIYNSQVLFAFDQQGNAGFNNTYMATALATGGFTTGSLGGPFCPVLYSGSGGANSTNNAIIITGQAALTTNGSGTVTQSFTTVRNFSNNNWSVVACFSYGGNLPSANMTLYTQLINANTFTITIAGGAASVGYEVSYIVAGF